MPNCQKLLNEETDSNIFQIKFIASFLRIGV